MKRGASGLCGVLAVDKPAGLTSHDVVDRIRRLAGERRVGHAGTLDPMATGLMLVGVGAATRLSQYLTGHDKGYDARIVFGISTDTDDAQGRAVRVCEGGESERVLAQLDPSQTVSGLVGCHQQLPPAYSAIKKNGVVAYKAAREGNALELEPRAVEVYAAAFAGAGLADVQVDVSGGGSVQRSLPFWDVHLQVSKGTYIRAIARDLGARLGCGAHLGALRRTAVGCVAVTEAFSPEQLEGMVQQGEQLPWADPARLLGFPVWELDGEQAADIANGKALKAPPGMEPGSVSCTHAGKLLAVCEQADGLCRPAAVIPGGVAGVASEA